MSAPEQIGTVELLRGRVYPSNADPGRDVYVEPGIYPLLTADGVTWWEMDGVVSRRAPGSVENLGDGMFAVSFGHDRLTSRAESVATKRFSAAEFAALLAEDGFTDGHPEQRLRVRLGTREGASS